MLIAALLINLLLIDHFSDGGVVFNPSRSDLATNEFGTDYPVKDKQPVESEKERQLEAVLPKPSPILEKPTVPPPVSSIPSASSEVALQSSVIPTTSSEVVASTSSDTTSVAVASEVASISSEAASVPPPQVVYTSTEALSTTAVTPLNITATPIIPLNVSTTSTSSLRPTRTRKPSPTKSVNYATILPTIPASSSASTFNLHDYKFDGKYVGWPLEQLCKETEWVPGLTFVCDNNSGGIGNIRNFILTCIRYAIDAGASELILPRIQRRSENDLANIFTAGFQPFSYFFDEQHFRSVFNKHCPQMSIYNMTENIPFAENIQKIENFYPKDLNVDLDGCDGRGVNRHLDQFRPKFHSWLNKRGWWPSVEDPVTIRFKWATFFEWPIYRDGPELAATFGDILRIRKDIQELAAIALAELSKFAGVKPKTNKFEAPYLGVHLRTESDALNFWPSFDEQSDGYLWAAKTHGFKHAYLACGSPTEAKRFADKAWNRLQLNVTTKLELLKGENRQRLDALSWDQQALVDFLMLEKSAHFTGCSFSSFAMNIAFKRHLMIDGIKTKQWKSPGDKYSTLVGRFESWYGDWMFMYECMWP